MPEIDGAGALKEIKAHAEGPNIDTPVICLTADAIIGARERYLAKGFNDYLTKPIDSVSLESMLRKYLPADKVINVKAADNKDESRDMPEAFGKLSGLVNAGVDVAQGIAHCGGDIVLYNEMLIEYLNTYPDKKEILDDSLKRCDMELYGVKVHSLKSTSAVIGVESVRALACKLEQAAMSGSCQDIKADHEELMKRYDGIAEVIRQVVADAGITGEADINTDVDDDVLEFEPDLKP